MLKPLLGPCDSYQLEPFAYEWAWTMARAQENNNWAPEEIQVGPDVADYKNPDLDPKHKHLFESVMAQLTTFDILRGDEIAECLQPIFQPAEIKHFLKRMAWDECVMEGTEVLTSEGWVKVEHLKRTDYVAQWSPDNSLSWVKPMEISVTVRDSHYVLGGSNYLKQRVTAGHRVPYITDTGNLLITSAADLTSNGHARHPLTGELVGGSKEFLTVYEKFLIALQADGTIHRPDAYTGERCGTLPVLFTLSKDRKQKRLENILQQLGWSWTCYFSPEKGNIKQRKTYRVSVPVAYRITKHFSDWIELGSISLPWAKAFIEELSYWDGYRVKTHDRIEYFTADQSNADMVQAVATLAGFRAHLVVRPDDRKETYKDQHLVYVSRDKTYIKGCSITKTKVDEPAVFYGIEVPSTFLLIRDAGKVSVTGNCIHTRSYRYVIENLGIPLEIYTRYSTVPEFKARVDMCDEISRPLFDILSQVYAVDCDLSLHKLPLHHKQSILRSMIFYFLIFEGTWFWVSLLGPIQQLARLGIFKGASEQFTYIARDEQQHVGFGIQLIREFMAQHPECVTKEFLEQVYTDVARAMNLERDYIHHCLKDGPILGYSAPEHIATAKYFANLRLGSVGLAAPFPEARHAFPWMSEQMELKKEKNFFEKRVTEYQAGGALSFDDHCPQHDQPGWSDPLA